METCEVTFDETQPCNSSVFECACDDEVGKKIFEDEEDDAGEDDGDDGEAPATRVPSTSTTSTTVQDGPSPTPPTIQQDQMEAATKGEVASRREAPRQVQVDHPPSVIIGDINKLRHGQGPEMLLTLLIQLLLLPLSRKILDTLYLILIG
jgi:hypothetical protein